MIKDPGATSRSVNSPMKKRLVSKKGKNPDETGFGSTAKKLMGKKG